MFSTQSETCFFLQCDTTHLQNVCKFLAGSLLCYLAALACADSIVVARGLVLTHKTGLVSARRRRRGGGADEEIVRAGAGAGAGALAAHCCKHTQFYTLANIIVVTLYAPRQPGELEVKVPREWRETGP